MTRHHLRTVLAIAILAALVIASVALLTGAVASDGLRPSAEAGASIRPATPSRLPTASTSASTAAPTAGPAASPTPDGGSGPALGVFIPGMPSNPSVLDQYAQLVGGKPAIAMWYQPWSEGGTFSAATASAVAQRGATPLVTWEPWAGKPNDPAWALSTIL